jgi:hypothetical protein
MSFTYPGASDLEDHKPNFQGTTYRVEEEEDRSIVLRTDKEDSPIVTEAKGKDHFRKARARAQVLAKKNSTDSRESVLRIPKTGETLGFGGKYGESLEDSQATLGNDEKEEEDQIIDNRDDKTSKKEDEDREKPELVKKAETLEAYEDEQDNLEKFEDVKLPDKCRSCGENERKEGSMVCEECSK